MKWLLMYVCCGVLSGCMQSSLNELSSLQTHQTEFEQQGGATAAALAVRYADSRVNCGGPSKPAFLCSGILFRGTIHSPVYHAWNPSPIAVGMGAVSFSYLRSDSHYRQISSTYDHGFIFYPIFSMPAGKQQIEILCVFPIDGATFDRDKPGCGAHRTYPQESKRCQSQGITTAEQWVAHTVRPGVAQSYYQCSFDVRDQMNEAAADSFYQAIRAMTLHSAVAFHSRNELMLATWSQDISEKLPIQAFYYVGNGLAAAQYDQQDFYEQSGGLRVPIIRMTLPASPAHRAAFSFEPTDQVFNPQSKVLRISSLTASPQADAFAFALDSGFPHTGFSGARFKINVAGGTPPYSFISADPGQASVNAVTGEVTVRGHQPVVFTVKDAVNNTVPYTMPKAKVWFTALACHMNWAAANRYSNSHGVALPQVHELGNGYLLRYPGALYSEWGDMMTGYRWPVGAFDPNNNHDATIPEYWTVQASQTGSYYTAGLNVGYVHHRPAGWKLCSVAVSRSP